MAAGEEIYDWWWSCVGGGSFGRQWWWERGVSVVARTGCVSGGGGRVWRDGLDGWGWRRENRGDGGNTILYEQISDWSGSGVRAKHITVKVTLDWVLCKIYKKEPGKRKEGADPTTLLASFVNENDVMVESFKHDDVYIQSTKLLQTSPATDGFLPHHASISVYDQPILNGET
ncbi:hypothetical protein RHMOL_Rhmol07G0282100 [Rhododendron molle]|uniref:Uncharacterized protein n=1 Tax=Rhododendron molle TaxID=49168 RepID=A0ACC0N7K4_RHOML|nr:hypothetical protein RHMOL_Rhmol07G0282100 [Rhododendron molle]